MELDATLMQYIVTGIIGAVIGSIFGASGLLFFPLRKYIENKFAVAEKQATDREMYQKEIYKITAEEKSISNRYLFWLKEATNAILSDCTNTCNKDNRNYFKSHLEEVAIELVGIEAKRKDLERNQLADFNIMEK